MAFIPTTNCAACALVFQGFAGDIQENTFHVQRTGAWTPTLLTAMAQGFQDWWYTGSGGKAYRTRMWNGITLLQSTARDLTTQSSPAVTVAANQASNVGADGANLPMASGMTFALTARTGLAGRSQRGRVFLIGLTAGFNTGVNQDTALAAAVNDEITAFNGLITKVTAVDAAATLVVLSTRHNNAPRSAGQTTAITAWGYSSLNLDYQRRRAPGHGRHH